MVAPEFLRSAEVRHWLAGVEPAWTMLDQDSYNRLREEPSATNRTISLEPKLGQQELAGSAVTRNLLLLLRGAADADGLKLTTTGSLSRSVVREMLGQIEMPDFDQQWLRSQKVVNEPDFLPLHFIRVLAEVSQLTRTDGKKLISTRVGTQMLAKERYGALQALLFHIAFWHTNLAYFDRCPIESWPQSQVGVVLWSLSASANDWLDRETLTRLCTVPVIGVLESIWDLGSFAMEARILRLLVWFGLMEYRLDESTGDIERHLYRKTRLFDHFLRFNVFTQIPLGTRH